jgi:hypothetical protein
MNSSSFHLAILQSAALLLPQAQRKEWLDEWRGELWHVQRDPGGQSLTAFCLGAFQDAFWLWRNHPSPDRFSLFAESPARCLSLLAALGALCASIALLLPPARTVLLGALYPRNLVMLTPAGETAPDMANGLIHPYPSVSREQFESLKVHGSDDFAGLAYYTPIPLVVDTPNGKQSLRAAGTTADLFRVLNIPLECGTSSAPALVLTRTAWRRYFNGERLAARGGLISDVRWNLPASVEAWLIEDETAFAALPAHTKGFVVGLLRYESLSNSQFHFIRLRNRSLGLLLIVLAIFLLTFILLSIMMSGSRRGHLRRIVPRRGLFLAAKTVLVLPIVLFVSMGLGSIPGRSISPLFFDIALFGSVVAVRWIIADQRKRCPVCLRLLANPVRMGESSRILLEWHGTELMCLRGHGVLYVPEWPAIWSARQCWMDLDPSWGGLFP